MVCSVAHWSDIIGVIVVKEGVLFGRRGLRVWFFETCGPSMYSWLTAETGGPRKLKKFSVRGVLAGRAPSLTVLFDRGNLVIQCTRTNHIGQCFRMKFPCIEYGNHNGNSKYVKARMKQPYQYCH